ncbi:MAG: hypothetical protein ACKO7B_21970, partial [Flavobacteriales bacterium]
MKKLFVLVVFIGALLAGTALHASDTIPPLGVRPDDPELMAIDNILVSGYLNHYCFSSDACLLNAFGYETDAVPTFSAEVVANRMQVLDRNTPFNLVYNSTVQ